MHNIEIKYYIQQSSVGSILNPPLGKFFTSEERVCIRNKLQEAGFTVTKSGYGFAVSRGDLHQLNVLTKEIESVLPPKETQLQIDAKRRSKNLAKAAQLLSQNNKVPSMTTPGEEFIDNFFVDKLNHLNRTSLLNFLNGTVDKFSGFFTLRQMERLIDAGCFESYEYTGRKINMVSLSKFKEMYQKAII